MEIGRDIGWITGLIKFFNRELLDFKIDKMIQIKKMIKKTYAFIDASNLFYGGEKSLGWKIDYLKLFKYLGKKYNTSKVFYFAGVETYKYKYDYLTNDTIPPVELKIIYLSF